MLFVSLAVILAGVVLFFDGQFFSIPLLLGGFLLLSIYTTSFLDFGEKRLFSIFQLFTSLVFVATTLGYIFAYPKYYFGLLLAIFCQLLVAIWSLWRK